MAVGWMNCCDKYFKSTPYHLDTSEEVLYILQLVARRIQPRLPMKSSVVALMFEYYVIYITVIIKLKGMNFCCRVDGNWKINCNNFAGALVRLYDSRRSSIAGIGR